IEAEGEFAKHPRVTAGGCKFLINLVRIYTLDGNMAVHKLQHEIASFRQNRAPNRQKYGTVGGSFNRRDTQHPARQFNVAVDACTGGLHPRAACIADLAAKRASTSLE